MTAPSDTVSDETDLATEDDIVPVPTSSELHPRLAQRPFTPGSVQSFGGAQGSAGPQGDPGPAGPQGDPGPSGGLATDTLLWNDEFDGTTLSYATDTGGGWWRTKGYEAPDDLSVGYTDFGGVTYNVNAADAAQFGVIAVANSVLTLKAVRNPATGGAVDAAPSQWLTPYLVSNHLTPDDRIGPLTWRFGYFEWRARYVTPVRGGWPALWLYNNIPGNPNGKNYAELDMMEIFGQASGQPWVATAHPDSTGSGVNVDMGVYSDDTADWHRYGIEWTDTGVYLYKDGEQVHALTGENASWFDTADLGVRIDICMDASWFDPANQSQPGDTVSPELDIDYIRIYANKPANLATGPADPGLPAPGVPPGGTANQVLTKIDSTDYNMQWYDAAGAIGPPGPPGNSYVGRLTAPSTAAPYTVTHGLNSVNPLVQVWDAVTGVLIAAEITVLDAASVSVRFTSAPPDDVNVVVAAGIPAAGGGTQVLGYRYVQSGAATTWTITHGLSFRPNAAVVDSTGRVIVPEIQYPSATQVVLTFSAAVAGECYLS